MLNLDLDFMNFKVKFIKIGVCKESELNTKY